MMVATTGNSPTINQVTPDPECDLDCAPTSWWNDGGCRDIELVRVRGHNVTLAVRRFIP